MEALYAKFGYPSLSKFWLIVKRDLPTVSFKEVKKFIDEQAIGEIYKKSAKKRNGMILSLSPDEIYQIDLIDMSKFARFNEGYNWIAIIVDVFSRKMWAYPLKRKESDEAYKELKPFFDSHECNEVMTDDGGEWKGKFGGMLEKKGIHHDSINTKVDGHKALGVVDRAIRTIKGVIYKSFTVSQNAKWIGKIKAYVEAYNDTPHSFLKGTPNDVYEKPSPEYVGRLLEMRAKYVEAPVVKAGDKVRILEKGVFKRGFTGGYSKEVFVVKNVSKFNVVLEDGRKVPLDEVISAKVPVTIENVEVKEADAEGQVMRKMNKEGIEKQEPRGKRDIKQVTVMNLGKEDKKKRVVKEFVIEKVFGHKVEDKKLYVEVKYSHLNDADNERYRWQPVKNFIFRDQVGDRAINPLVYKYFKTNGLEKLLEKYA